MTYPKNQVLQHTVPVSKFIRQAVQDGVSIKDILATVANKFENSPSSLGTLYKLYGNDIAEARAEIVGKVGNTVVAQALEGHFASQEFFLRSKGGWSPQNTVNEADITGIDPDTDSSAVDALMTLLGKEPDDSGDLEV
tara:strand:+ start:1731 stop:2144 length:414 start_codon:yes stop_codon:yes gene_type:complete